eukprot:3715750-Prymnesium_polylepis.1
MGGRETRVSTLLVGRWGSDSVCESGSAVSSQAVAGGMAGADAVSSDGPHRVRHFLRVLGGGGRGGRCT